MLIKTIHYLSIRYILIVLLHRQIFPGFGGASFYMPSKGGIGNKSDG